MTLREPVSPLPQEKGAGVMGNARSGGKLQSLERGQWYFPGCGRTVGARVLSHLRGLSVLLVVLSSFLARGLYVFYWVTSHSEEGKGSRDPRPFPRNLPPKQLPEMLFPAKVLSSQAFSAGACSKIPFPSAGSSQIDTRNCF